MSFCEFQACPDVFDALLALQVFARHCHVQPSAMSAVLVIFKLINQADHANALHHQAHGHPDAELHMSLPQTIEAIVRLAHACKRSSASSHGLLSDCLRQFLVQEILPHGQRLDADDFRRAVFCARRLAPVLTAIRATIGKWHSATNHSNRTSNSNMHLRDYFAVLDGAKLVDRCGGSCRRRTLR